MVQDFRRAPGRPTVEWAARAVAPGSRVVRGRRLPGGILSSVHQLDVVDPGGARHRLVLKRWVGDQRQEGIPILDRETAVLRALDGSALPVPRLVASSRGEETEGAPALLITRLPGRSDLAPRDPTAWLGQMGRTLARIHSSSVAAPVSEPWGADAIPPAVPTWSTRPELWNEAAAILNGPAPEGACFIHGDYQHFNLLWSRGRLTGVIDWAEGGWGHPDRDLGHCQLNLAVLYSPKWAREFAAAYQAEAGRVPDPWWTLYSVCLYGEGEHMRRTIPVQVAGRAPVDTAGMNGRVEDLIEMILEKAD